MAEAKYSVIGATASGETTSQTVKCNASTAIGNYMIAECMVGNGLLTPAMSGWEELGKGSNVVGESLITTWFGKYATEAGEKSFTVTWGGTKIYNACQIATIKEVHATEAVPAGVAKFKVNSTASKSVKVPSATPSVTGCVSYISAGINQTGTGTPPASWIERQDNTVGDYVATRDNTPAEASGELTITLTEERITITAQIIIQPEAVASTVLSSSMVV